MRIIFLDFDGVLVTTQYQQLSPATADPVCARWLRWLVIQADAHIVVSSSWRKGGLQKMKSILRYWRVAPSGRVIGVTPDLSHRRNSGLHVAVERGVEIAAYLGEPEPWVADKFVILDDEGDMGELRSHLVMTTPHRGVGEAEAWAALQHLVGPHMGCAPFLMYPATKAEKLHVRAFVERQSGFSREQWEQAQQSWGHSGFRGWWVLETGGTGQTTAVAWYQHIYKPGSMECRPAVIIDALCRAAGIGLNGLASDPVARAAMAASPIQTERDLAHVFIEDSRPEAV